jgi:hypothetical protein
VPMPMSLPRRMAEPPATKTHSLQQGGVTTAPIIRYCLADA